MRILDKILPPLRLLESPTGDLARLSLRQLRAENSVAIHLVVWLSVSGFIVFLNLVSDPTETPSIFLALIWGVFVALHRWKTLGGRRRNYAERHQVLSDRMRREKEDAAEETGVGLLRKKLIRATEEARTALRGVSPGIAAEVSRGETEALTLVAWLDEAEELLESHRVDPRLRRSVAGKLSDPRNLDAHDALERLLSSLDQHDGRLALLEREATERRSRVEGFLLAIENVKIAHSGGGIVPEVSASVSQRVALLGDGDDGGTSHHPGADADARIREEVRLAQDLQRSILPGGAPRVPGLEVAHVYRPSSEVGGDFYDFYTPSSHRLLMALGDASGHGLDSSMVSSMAKSALYMQMSAGRDLPRSMEEINHMMCDTLGRRRFMTLALVELDTGEGRISWANAGQVYPLLLRDGEIRELEQPGYPLGVRRDVTFTTRQENLEADDLLLLLTDGYVEATSGDGEVYGWDRLMERLVELRDTGPQAVVDRLSDDLTRHLGSASPQDDVTLIVVRYRPET